MSRSRRDSLLALDHGLLVLRRLWQRGELRAFFASRLDKTIELEHYYAVTPAFRAVYHDIDYTYGGLVSPAVSMPYNSRNAALSGSAI